jgi:hypothetical protein
MTRAMQLARGAVKDELKRHKIRLADVEARDVTSWATVYLDDHPELYTDAAYTIRAWVARGVFGKRAQRAFANLTSDAQTPNAQSIGTSAVQISGAK